MNGADLLLDSALQINSGSGVALIADDVSVSYRELDTAANRAGAAFLKLGVKKADRVLMIVSDRKEFFFAYLGAMKIGAVPVALNLRLSESELAYIIDDSQAALLIIDDVFSETAKIALGSANHLPRVIQTGGTLTNPGWVDFDSLISTVSKPVSSQSMNADDMALWMYTSGTTGRPKAVIHKLSSLIAAESYLKSIYGLKPGQRIYCSSKLFFAFSLGHCLIAALRIGASVILNPSWPDTDAVAKTVMTHHPDVILSVPTMYKNLLHNDPDLKQSFKSVTTFISAGEKLPESIYNKWLSATGKPIHEGIGATETLMMFLGNRPGDDYTGATGKPFPGVDVELRDESGKPVPEPGTPGVMWVKSPHLAVGYHHQPEQTKTAFVDGRYVTGDVFIKDDEGNYYHQGRADDMMKISGQWVSPAEIEDCIIKHPDVIEAAVIGIENKEGLIRLGLCLVSRGGPQERNELEQQLVQLMTSKLAVYKCPRRFIHLAELPRTASGKLQRFRLRQIIADGV